MENIATGKLSAAEARRQKILARSKDRLTQITGTYSGIPSTDARTGKLFEDRRDADEVFDTPETTTSSSLPEIPPRSVNVNDSVQPGSKPQPTGVPVVPAIPLLSPSGHLHSTYKPPKPQPESESESAVFSAGIGDATDIAGTEAAAVPQIPDLGLGPAVRTSLGVRCLTAILFAWATSQSLLPGRLSTIPPILVLLSTQVCMVGAAWMICSVNPKLKAPRGGGYIGSWKYRQFDVLDVIPGLKPLLGLLLDVGAFVKSLLDDVALFMFVVVLISMV